MDAKLKAKAMTDDQLDGVAGGWIVFGGEEWKDNTTRLELGSRQEVDNMTRREIDDLFNSNGTKNKQPTLNTYSYKLRLSQILCKLPVAM